MTPLDSVALIAGLLIAIGGLLWYLLITTEGVYLGRRVVIWLYDVYARRYDRIKNYNRGWEAITLGGPVLDALCDIATPLILDVATGTARLPLCLLDDPGFDGQIVGLDYSRRMLSVAAEKLTAHNSHPHSPVALIHGRAEELPFDDGTFDAVICLEALEFMMNQDTILAEIVRVARPGALILLTNRKGSGAWLMPLKTQKAETLATRLRERYGLIDVHIQIWQVDYEQVWAFKPGDLEPALDRASVSAQAEVETLDTIDTLETILRCPRCQQRQLRRVDGQMQCQNCQTGIQIGSDGVLNYEP